MPSSSRSSRASSTRTAPTAIEHVPSGLVHGAVTDANDGEPVAGAHDHRQARRPDDHDRRRRQRTRSACGPARTPSRPRHELRRPRPSQADRRRRRRLHDRLRPRRVGRRASTPTEVSATVDFGETTDRRRHPVEHRHRAAHLGGARSATTASRCRSCRRRRPRSAQRDLGSASRPRPASRRPVINDTTPGPVRHATLSTIITDPAGDSLDSNDVIDGPGRLRRRDGRLDRRSTSGVDHADGPGRRLRLPRHRPGSVDRRPGRGLLRPADAGRRHGVLRRPVPIANSDGDRLRSSTPRRSRSSPRSRRRSRTTRSASTSRSRRSAATTGSSTPRWSSALQAPSDWAPDEGHGTIEPFIDAPWLSEIAGVRHDRTRRLRRS